MVWIRVTEWFCVFFFSSRRRHTRLQGDWSSDVCSSDLGVNPAGCARHTRLLLVGLLALVACQSTGRERQSPGAPAWLLERARQERELAARSSVAHDFGFSDGRAASGISFENHGVDDAGKADKKVHYD